MWLICVDTGGTFTDCIAFAPDQSEARRAKVLSTSALRARVIERLTDTKLRIEHGWPACDDLVRGFAVRRLGDFSTGEEYPDRESLGHVRSFDAAESILELTEVATTIVAGQVIECRSGEPAPILAARLVTRTPAGNPLPPMEMRLATTRGTNALLERKGATLAMFITRGFADLLRIGDQSRPDLFALAIRKRQPLHQHVVEVSERLAADGSVIATLDEDEVRSAAMKLLAAGVSVAAVALMHAYRNPAHEQRVAAILHECGFTHVSGSSALAPLIRIVPRAETAVVNAYLSPIIEDYLARVDACMADDGANRLRVMTSAGGLVRAARYHACDSLLSGPAGGVVGAAVAARCSGFNRIIGFDMGGTSTDATRYDGRLLYRFEHTVADARLLTPALAIETVAAGGGSICSFELGGLTVGPHSAGAQPGPACYGLGGPLTLTDANLLLGRLDPARFEVPIDAAPAARALEKLCDCIAAETGTAPQPNELLEGLLDIANQRMAAAIEQVTVRQGVDPAEYALLCFGGAGGQHACAIAERLAIKTVIMPPDASLLSAWGLHAAVIERFAQRQVSRHLDDCAGSLQRWLGELGQKAASAVAEEGVDAESIRVERRLLNLRLLGQESSLSVELPAEGWSATLDDLRDRFVDAYLRMYGHSPPLERKPIEIESMRVTAVAASSALRSTAPIASAEERAEQPQPRTTTARFGGRWVDVPVHERSHSAIGAVVSGPALIVERHSTLVVEPGWRVTIDDAGAMVAMRIPDHAAAPSIARSELVELELFSNRLEAIATDMGHVLQRIAVSTNVKERLDFSCAVLDAEGRLIVNAPHIPVHLGAMGVCVRAVEQRLRLKPGDVAITNHPAYGGSHLPDITVITPVYGAGDALIGYVACRAHHAELGGERPGSMPPAATTLTEEGIVIAPQLLVSDGASRLDDIERLLRSGPWPSRVVEDNLADLQAMTAANHRGAAALRRLFAEAGQRRAVEHMNAVAARAAAIMGAALQRLPQRKLDAQERLDDGSVLRVSIDLRRRPVIIDFDGTSPRHPGNLNATPAIVRSAVMYVLRLLIGERVPLNEGVMDLIDIRLPQDSILNPTFHDDPARCPAVVGGNTETSQRLVDTLLKAFGVAACSQGTMNNVLFGNDRFGYYETVCGGAGATADADGAHVVHTHMTNTRLTDPEVLEHRYPVRLLRAAIRKGSGGAGAHRGGDGVVREIMFLEPMSLSILSQHRVEQPYGMHGGAHGAAGRQQLIRATGGVEELPPIATAEVLAGDRLVLETPGGGGWGAGAERGAAARFPGH